ncbi:MAG: response regulator [Lysobacter sp.]|nr:response regulator [Lysobacter sp.]
MLDLIRIEDERLETERLEAERRETERLGAELLEQHAFEANLLEAERLLAEGEDETSGGLSEAAFESDDLGAFLDLPSDAVEPAFVEDTAFADDIPPAKTVSEGASDVPVFADAPAFAEEELPAFFDMSEIPSRTEPAAELPEPLPAAAEDPDQALEMDELDAELIDIFVDEARDLLDHSDQLLVRLRDAPEERDIIVGLQRDLHTLKGGARMAGIMPVGELGHTMESMLEAVAEQRTQIGAQDIPLLERGFDRLHAMVTRVGARRAIGMPARLIGEFEERVYGRSATEAEKQDTAESFEFENAAVETAFDDASAEAASSLGALSAPIEFGGAIGDDEAGLRGTQEQVRVRAELLDRLVNYAGEVAIYRSRLEQQLGAFRGATAEMGQTNLRLRDQLRRLEIETEAQIIARYQREGENRDATFDPLELDRFSTLQQLSRALAETATDLTSLQATLDDLTQQYETLLLQQSRVSSELQEGLMRTRMLPFDTVVPRLRRVLRQAATDTGKSVQLKVDGAQGELDRNVLERMTAPLEHMLRNAVAHGLEKPGKRKSSGKPEEGVVRIAVRKEGSEVVLQISDDGAGLDRKAIRERAEARGLVRKEATLSNAQLDAMILEPGFSTANEVSRLAGRGVGMDVVASEVRQLGGTLVIQSERGKGSSFTLRLPQTLAVTQAAFVRIGETLFAVPIASVRGVGRIQRETLASGGSIYRYGNEEYVLHDLGKLLGAAPAKAEGQLQMPLLLTRSGDLHVAVSVDQIVGNREIVVKPIGPQVASIPGIFGATIMGDGSVVVILDVAPLVRRIAAQPDIVEEQAPVSASEHRQVPLVMVVDDSITMRKVTGRVLERNNFEVVTAKDGLDALERLADRVPDLMLLDIEMPRMDGYELATAMKDDPRLRNVPIIMITSRTGEKHRQRAMDIGVNRYLGKPYQENELMRNVFALLEGKAPNTVSRDG